MWETFKAEDFRIGPEEARVVEVVVVVVVVEEDITELYTGDRLLINQVNCFV